MFKRSFIWLAAALLCAPAPAVIAADAAPAAAAAPTVVAEYELSTATFHMGTLVRVKVFGDSEAEARRLAELVDAEVARFDDMMSVHKDTPLNAVNRNAGTRVEVTPEIAEMSRQALEIADMTGSAFEPMIGPLVNLWKIGFGGNSVPDDESIRKALELVDHRKVEISEENGRWFMRIGEGQFADMGGIAKGYIGQKLMERLRLEGARHALLDLGGNIIAVGEKAPGVPWRIGLQSPDKSRGDYFAVLAVSDVNVITSGAYERNFEKDGHRYGHILSPVTGRPVKTDLASVTIVDRDGGRADALCTAIFAMGWERAEAFLRAHPDIQVVLLRDDLREMLVSASLRDKIQPYDPNLTVRWLEAR